MTADALIRNRDAIVGDVAEGLADPKPLGTDRRHEHMRYWEPWVRATILDFELISLPAFPEQSQGHLHALVPPGGAAREIATLTAPDGTFFAKQWQHVLLQAELREDRASEILAQLGLPIAFWTPIANLHPSRTPKTLELLDAALRLANFVEMRFKHALACRRPLEYSSQVQPMILTPGHGSLPSGHSTEAFTVAHVLAGLFEPGRQGRDEGAADATGGARRDQPPDRGRALPGRQRGRSGARQRARRVLPLPMQGRGPVRAWSFAPEDFGADSDFDWTKVALDPPVKGGD